MTRPSWETLRPWLGTAARLVLGIVWIWASVSKISDPRTFVQAVRAYDATPEWLSKAIGYGLPVLEFALGVLLILGIAVRIAAATSGVLLVVFLIGIIEVAARGIKLECGCFGDGGVTDTGTAYTLDILRDLGLLVLAVYLVVWSMTRVSIEEFIARGDYVEVPSAKRMRTEQGRRKYYAELAKKQETARSRDRWVAGSLSAVVVLVALIGIGVQASRAKITGVTPGANSTVANGVTFGKKAPATVDIYEDFQCPFCLKFETAVDKTMDADVRANRAQVHFHTLSFLDRASNGHRYSTRAANAAICMSDVTPDPPLTGPDLFVRFHNLLFTKAVQPTEGSNGLSNGRLEKLAIQAGLAAKLRADFDTCVENETHVPLVEAITERASKDGITSTPTVMVNGKSISPTLAAYQAAVAEALKTGPKPNPSKTPTPTPTPSVTTTPSGSGAPSSPSTSPSKSASKSASSSKSASKSPSKSPSKPASSSKKPKPTKSAKHS